MRSRIGSARSRRITPTDPSPGLPSRSMADERPYSPGLEGVVAAETALGFVDGERGQLLYRGYRIGDLVEHGSYPAVANLLWTGEWDPDHHLPTSPVPEAVLTTLRALDAYFIVGAEHGLNASTFTARVIVSTRSDLASAVAGAIGCLKGPLHGGAPSEVVEQIHQVGSVERAEQWVNDTLGKGERLMGFGHRVYRAYDPRAAALRKVAESMEHPPEWLALATAVEDVALRVLAERHPERALKTNVELYAAPGR